MILTPGPSLQVTPAADAIVQKYAADHLIANGTGKIEYFIWWYGTKQGLAFFKKKHGVWLSCSVTKSLGELGLADDGNTALMTKGEADNAWLFDGESSNSEHTSAFSC